MLADPLLDMLSTYLPRYPAGKRTLRPANPSMPEANCCGLGRWVFFFRQGQTARLRKGVRISGWTRGLGVASKLDWVARPYHTRHGEAERPGQTTPALGVDAENLRCAAHASLPHGARVVRWGDWRLLLARFLGCRVAALAPSPARPGDATHLQAETGR